MYCVCCGTPLSEDNQAGSVCYLCKRRHRPRRGYHWGVPITVHYCARCGRPYTPPDASMTHPSCRHIFRPITLYPQVSPGL